MENKSYPAVEAVDLTRVFGAREVLSGLSFSVPAGQVCGVLGVNGVGKTTLLKLLSGLLRPSAGWASVCGFDSVKDRREVLGVLGLLIETPVFYDHLSARENLELHLGYMGAEGDIPAALARMGLLDAKERPVGRFSLGMRQRLAVARALVHRPRVLLLDEPLGGLDPAAIREMRTLLRDLAREGMTLLVSSHLLGEVEQTADRVLVLSRGRLALDASMAELRSAHPEDLEDHLIACMKGEAE